MSNAAVVVVGATNRPNDIDSAFLRRLPVLIETKTPSLEGRIDIIRKMLSKLQLSDDVDINAIALRTPDFTGSELRELVRVASVQRIKGMAEKVKSITNTTTTGNIDLENFKMKSISASHTPLMMKDFEYALLKTCRSGRIIQSSCYHIIHVSLLKISFCFFTWLNI